MALTLKFTPDVTDCTSLLISDTTGIYSATLPLNLGGWGSPNAAIADVQTATLTITTAATAVPYVIDVFPTLPNTDDTPFEVTPEMIGYTTKIPTQILKVIYTVTGLLPSGTPFTFSTYCYVLIGCDIECCKKQLLADSASKVACSCEDACSCTCQNGGLNFSAVQVSVMLAGLKELICNKQFNKANELLNLLVKICNCK